MLLTVKSLELTIASKSFLKFEKALYEYVVSILQNHIAEHSKYKQDSQSQDTYQNAKAFLQ